MTPTELLLEEFSRIHSVVARVLKNATLATLTFRADADANSIAWLIWHLSRLQDDHIADLAGRPQVYTSQGWAERFDLPFGPATTGYGHKSADVAAVRADADLLRGYYEAVHTGTVAYLNTLDDADLNRVVDDSWTPAVTVGVRLASVLSDDLQHAGQAAFVRGLADRAGV
ncbi:mycothiol transferase [Cryobacterium gelidum]|uniref:DinB family protein n=1 Tax=Cryobacterium gelidum TaxID=1259164 RepID=A0A4R9AYG4_9MICO|nr:DinB family protein [Cryobacterium gelidum]TFD71383.1 DinB family protein [Cryobacterium gelidum]